MMLLDAMKSTYPVTEQVSQKGIGSNLNVAVARNDCFGPLVPSIRIHAVSQKFHTKPFLDETHTTYNRITSITKLSPRSCHHTEYSDSKVLNEGSRSRTPQAPNTSARTKRSRNPFSRKAITSRPLQHHVLPSEEKKISRLAPLQPRINLVHDIMTRIVSPSNTSLLDTVWQDPLLQERLLLDGVDVQPGADMPCDVAMERPHAWVVCIILQHEVARCASSTRLHELHVAALSVVLVCDGTVPGADAFGEDVEIVAMKMHGVGGRERILNNDADGAVSAEIVDVPFGVERVRDVALVGEDENGVTLGG